MGTRWVGLGAGPSPPDPRPQSSSHIPGTPPQGLLRPAGSARAQKGRDGHEIQHGRAGWGQGHSGELGPGRLDRALCLRGGRGNFHLFWGAGGVRRGWGQDPRTPPSWRVYPKGRLIQSPPAQAAVGIFTHTYYTHILTAHPPHIPTLTIAPARISLLSSPCRPFPDRSFLSPDLATPFISSFLLLFPPRDHHTLL